MAQVAAAREMEDSDIGLGSKPCAVMRCAVALKVVSVERGYPLRLYHPDIGI